MQTNVSVIVFVALLFLSACAAPRAVQHSGKVTPKGQFKAGFNYSANISTQPIKALSDATTAAVKAIQGQDTIYLNEQVNYLTRGLLAYTLDPISSSLDFYLRYGLASRVDVGYKYFVGTHVVDAMYQFMGTTGSPSDEATAENTGYFGSAGIQFSRQKSTLPKAFRLLNEAANILQFGASRTDILVPVVISKSFGQEEKYGNISFGAAYNRTFIRYYFTPSNLVQQQADQQNYVPVRSINEKQSYGAIGLFANAKLGYKYIYLLPSLAVYYQNYGTFTLPGGSQTKLKGFTYIPSLGVQLYIGKGR